MNVPRPGGENRRWRPAVPGVAVLRGYRRRWLRGDLVAGVTVAAYLVPQVMAHAAVSLGCRRWRARGPRCRSRNVLTWWTPIRNLRIAGQSR